MVKVPPQSLVDRARAATRTLFERDVLQLARLQAAGVPRVLHLARPGEWTYAVLAPTTGLTWQVWLHARPSERAALQVAIALTHALVQLHAWGFVYADLSADHIRIAHGSAVQLVDLGGLHRPTPFDPDHNLSVLTQLLEHLARAISDATGQQALLTRLEAWRSAAKPLTDLLRSLYVRRDQVAGRSPIVSCSGLSPRLGSDVSRLRQSGRSELAQLQQEFEDGTLNPISVVAASEGAGKTRLLTELSEFLLARGVNVLAANCANNECTPFSTIQRLIEHHLRDLEPQDAAVRARYEDALRTAAGAFGPRLRLLSTRLERVFEPAETPLVAGDARASFMDGLSEFLRRYSESIGPCAVLLDDLEHLDASSRMVLARLSTSLRRGGPFVVAALRSTSDGPPESLARFDAMLAPGLLRRVTLGPLGALEARHLIGELLGTDAISHAGVVEPLVQLSDGTPRCLTELVELALDRRLLAPRDGRWELEVGPLRRLRLPASSRALVEQRLGALDGHMLQILQAAAALRVRIDANLLARVVGVDVQSARGTLERAMAEALLVRDEQGCYTFVHDSIGEALLRPLSEAARRGLHQAIADALRSVPAHTHANAFTLARHLALGVVEHEPAAALVVLTRAGALAARAYDDALTLLFLRAAERAAQAAKLQLDRALYLDLAEASLRTGAAADSLRYFQEALARSRPGFESAHVLGRLAWLHHFDGRAPACWEALSGALRELGQVVPHEAPASLLRQGANCFARSWRLARSTRNDHAHSETLCELYALCVRVAIEVGNPVRGLSALWQLLWIARDLPPCRALVEAELLKAFVLATLGKHAPYRSALERAYALAEQLGDPFARAKCHQVHHALAGWRGDLAQWVQQAHACMDEHVSYMELGELCLVAYGMYAGEVVLGKPELGFGWLERAFTRAQQIGCAPAMFSLIEESACAHLLTFGREAEAEDLMRRLSHIRRTPLHPSSYFHLLSFQNRAQRWFSEGQRSEELEALLHEWRRLGQQPARAHLAVALFYVHVAHARMHQCLRATVAERPALLAKLQAALADLDKLPGTTVIAAHREVTRACNAFLSGDHPSAERGLVQAEQLAREQHCVWVSFAAARLRAHMLSAQGRVPAAREHARFAAQLAREYGPPHRLRTICDEFELSEAAQPESPSARRHLEALLHIAHASSRELSPHHQAQFVLDELLRTLNAERGFLFTANESNGGALQCLAARRQPGQALAPDLAPAERSLVEQVYASGRTALFAPALAGGHTGVAVALVLRELVVGVIYLDRNSARGAFNREAVTLIEALANQVPVLLELAHALHERSRLERNLREAQKMEAIGRLAAGIAHDFNNVLGTIEFSASCLTDRLVEGGCEELADIREAAGRGAALTRHLMLFARGNAVPRQRVDLVEQLRQLEPTLRRLSRARVRLDVQVPDGALAALAEPHLIERVVMNLWGNANDATSDGGSISLRLSHAPELPAQLTASDVTPPAPFGYADISVCDTGHGMTDETRARMFEPFFTTKSEAEGTGLGLAIVYAIVQQCDGHICAQSAPGRGTTFRVLLPLCEPAQPGAGTPAPKASARAPARSVCIVDDDETYRSLLARVVRRAGYEVLTASCGKDALRVIADAEQLPDLIVTDVHMPGLDGVELVRRLREDQPELKVLFISGKEREECEPALPNARARFLQKPFRSEVLLREIASMLDSCETTAQTDADPAIANGL